MKLLVVSHACAAPINQALYAEVQRQTGWEVSLVVPANWRDEYERKSIPQRWPAFRGELIPIPVRQSGNIILHTYCTSFTRLLKDRRPDAIYMAHEPYAAATAQVYWAHGRAGLSGPIGFYTAQNIYKRYPPPFRWTEAWVMRRSRFAFPISTEVDAVSRRKGYIGSSTILPLAIDPAVYYPRPDAAEVKSGLVARPGDKLLGYVGRLVPEKGLLTLLDALALIPDVRWTLAVVGSGTLEADLRAKAEASGLADRVRFCGFIPHADAPRMLSAMDVLILPSETQPNWREQFGRVVLEAMACGTPVLGSDSGEIPVLIAQTGGGIIFPERNALSLAAAVENLVANDSTRKYLAQRGAESIILKYGIPAVAKTFAATIAHAALPKP